MGTAMVCDQVLRRTTIIVLIILLVVYCHLLPGASIRDTGISH